MRFCCHCWTVPWKGGTAVRVCRRWKGRTAQEILSKVRTKSRCIIVEQNYVNERNFQRIRKRKITRIKRRGKNKNPKKSILILDANYFFTFLFDLLFFFFLFFFFFFFFF
eukprot:PhF_6_TR39063/c1_g1_i1/m.58459